ncbi:uncharacterized protein LOC135051488 [Pseudophryne corroboree]|uniref:uncharacterized protein LOC135051488 n=1 Tax=Pseudophryne corroboree TaxID=495146 RepID=UPI0030819C0E
MGRSNGIGTISENGQCGKSHSMKTILPKKGNNNKNYKKNSKGSSQSNQDHEQVLQANVETNMSSKTLDYQNGNIYEIHKSNHADIHSSSKTTPKKVIEQKSRTLKVSSSQGKEASNSETKKEVFHFWSTKVNNIHEGSEEKTSVAKSSAGDHLKNIITNQPADSTQEDHGRGCDFSKNPFEIRPLKRKKRDELFPPVGFTHIDDYVLSLSNQIQSQNASVKEIVHKITKKSTNNIEKIRAIWIWLCHNISYDVEGYLGLSQKLYRPEDVLEKRKAVCSGYAGLCKEMCRYIISTRHQPTFLGSLTLV